MPRWLRLSLTALAALVALLVVLLTAVQVPAVSTWAVNQLAGLAPFTPGWRLHVGRAEGSWIRRLRLTDITLHHDTVLVARVGSLEARYGLLGLAIGIPTVDALLVDDVEVTATRGADGWDLAAVLEQDSTAVDEPPEPGGFVLDTLGVTNVRARAVFTPDSIYVLRDLVLEAHDIRTGRVTTGTLDTLGATLEPPTGSHLSVAARGALEPEVFTLPVLALRGDRTRVSGQAVVPLDYTDPAALDRLTADFRAAPLDLTEVAAFVPAVAPGHDLVLDLTARGEAGRAVATFDAQLGAGMLAVEARMAPPRDGAVDVAVAGEVRALDPALLLASAPAGVVAGTFDAELDGPGWSRASGQVNVDLTASRVGTTDIDFVRLRAPVADGRTEFTLATELLDGRAEASGWARPFDERPAYDVEAEARGFPQLASLAAPLGVPSDETVVVAVRAAGDGVSLADARVSGRLDLSAAGATGPDSLLGSVPFTLTDGELDARPDLPLQGGRLTGLVEADLLANPLDARARLTLTGVEQGARVDSVMLDAAWRDATATFDVDARFPGEGQLALAGRARPQDDVPTVSITRGEFSNLDLGAILPRDSLRTDLNGRFTAEVVGFDPATLEASADLTLDPSGVNQASIEQGAAMIRLADGSYNARLEATGPDGRLEAVATGVALGDERTVTTSGSATVRDLDRWAGRRTFDGDLDARFDFAGAFDSTGIVQADGWVSARGQVGEVALDSLHAAVRAEGRTSLRVDTVLVRSNAMIADGGGVLALRAGPDTTAFGLDGAIIDAAPIAATLDRSDLVVDSARFTVRAAGPATATRVTGLAAIANLIMGTSQVQRLDASAELVLDEMRFRSGSGQVTIPGAVFGGVPARDLAFEARYDSVVSASASVILARDLAVAMRFAGTVAGDTVAGQVEELSLENPSRRWDVARPARVMLTPVIEVDSLILASEGGRRIALDGRLVPEGANDLTLAFDGLEFDMFRGGGIDFLQGSLDGTVHYAGTAAAPAADGQVTWGVVGRDAEPAGELGAEFGWTPAGVQLDARVEHADGSRLTAVGYVPASAWADAETAAASTDTIGLVIQSDGLNLQLFEALTPPEAIKRLAGRLVLDARLSGPASTARAEGSVRLEEAFGEFPAIGVAYDSIGLDASLSGGEFRLARLDLRTGKGRLEASGQASLRPIANPSFDFRAEFDRFVLARNKLLRSVVDSGGLALSGTLQAPVLEGRLVMGRTDAYVDGSGTATDAESVELTQAELEQLARDFGPSVLADPVESAALERFRMDLQVAMPGGVWVRRRREPKVDIEVRGEIAITQEPGGEMQFNGTVEPVPGRGYLQVYGKEFRLTGGEVKLAGPVAATAFEVVAEYEVENKGGLESEPITITVETSGTLDTLDVRFGSSPSMSQDDIVSYLLTGRPASDNVLASAEGGSVGADLAVNEIAEGLSSAAGQAVGLDVFQIKPDGLRGLTMVAGQYVLPDLFLSFEQPVQIKTDAETKTPPGPSFEVEYGINSWLRSTVRAGAKPFALFLKGRRAY